MASSPNASQMSAAGSTHRVGSGERESLAGTLTIGAEDDQTADRQPPSSYSGIKSSTPAGSKVGSIEDLRSSHHAVKSQLDESNDTSPDSQADIETVGSGMDNTTRQNSGSSLSVTEDIEPEQEVTMTAARQANLHETHDSENSSHGHITQPPENPTPDVSSPSSSSLDMQESQTLDEQGNSSSFEMNRDIAEVAYPQEYINVETNADDTDTDTTAGDTDVQSLTSLSPDTKHQVSLSKLNTTPETSAELIQLQLAADIGFDPSQIVTSTPKDGCSLRMSRMGLGEDDMDSIPSPPQILSNSRFPDSVEHRPSILRNRELSASSTRFPPDVSERSILRDSKVSFQDVIKMHNFESDREADNSVPETRRPHLDEDVNLEMPMFAAEYEEVPTEDKNGSTQHQPFLSRTDHGSSKSSPVLPSSAPPDLLYTETHKSCNRIDEVVLSDFVQEVLKVSQTEGGKLPKEDVSERDSFISYTTPSILLQIRDAETHASAEVLSDTTPSDIMQRSDADTVANASVDSMMHYTTPSVLIHKTETTTKPLSESQPDPDRSRRTVSVAEVTSALLDCFKSENPLKAASKQVIQDFVKEMKSIDRKTQASTVSHPGFTSVVNKLENIIQKEVSPRCRSLGYVSHPQQDKLYDIRHPLLKRPIVAGLKSKSLYTKNSPKECRGGRQQASMPAFGNQNAGSQKTKSATIASSHDSVPVGRYDSEDFFASDEMSEDDDSTWEQWDSILSYLMASIDESGLSQGEVSSASIEKGSHVKESTRINTDPGFISELESSKARDLVLLSPRSQQKAKMQNMVLVNQVIVDMENAVSQYKQNMAGEKDDKDDGHMKMKLPSPCDTVKSVTKNPAERPETSPYPSPPVSSPHSPQSVRTFSWSVSPIHSDTNLVIKEINNHLMKMKHEDQNHPACPAHQKPNSEFMYSSKKQPSSEPSSEDLISKHTNPLRYASTKADVAESSSPYMYNKTVASPARPFNVYNYLGQKTGASLPTSRVNSPSIDQYSGGSRRKAASADVSRFLVEKEVLDSQLRKLQVENSTLQTENKLLKEKHNRGQARIVQLESQLREVKHEAVTLTSEMRDGMSAVTQRTQNRSEIELRHLQHKVDDLTAQLNVVTAQNASLKKLLDSSRSSTENSHTTKASERSRIIESFKVENFCLKDELRQAKRLLEESERVRGEESERRQKASAQVVRLTEVKALLQQQLEQAGGGSVAERQVKSLERRLKITEDRLHQERTDRANKLSDMEEKLINENARLQVAEKELKRQLTRERDKHRNIEQKYKDLRDENERLRVLLAETNNAITDNAGLAKLRGGHQKHAEIKHIMEQIKKDVALGPGQEQDIIWLIWQRNASLTRQIKEWEVALEEVKVDHGEVRHGLKLIRDERAMLEDRIGRYKNTLEDVSKEKEELETILHGRVKELTQAHHGSVAEARNLRDLNAAITAENESLRCSLTCPHATSGSRDQQITTTEAQLESLRSRLRTAESESAQRSREERLLEAELGSVRTQLTAKNAALEEALSELDRMHSGHLDGGDLLDVKQQQIDKLITQVQSLQEDVRLWQEKVTAAHTERSQLEMHIDQLSTSKIMSKLSTDATHMAESDKLALEAELHEKDSQVLRLSVQYKAVEEEVQRTKQQLAASRQHAEQLSHQLDQLQTQLCQKTRMLERMTSTQSDQGVQIKALRDNLTTANKELIEKTAQMRALQVEHEQLNTRYQHLETDSQGAAPAAPSAGQLGTHQHLLEYERESARRDLDRVNHAMNLIIQENSDLLGRMRELRQDLLRERAQLCQLTSDKVEAEQQLHLCRDDRDTLMTQKDRLQGDLSRISADIQNNIVQLEDEAYRSKVDYETLYPTLNADGKKVVIELGTVHRLLEARAAEVQLYRDTIERQKAEIQSVNRRVELLQDEQRHNRDDIDGLTKELSVKMRENEVAVVSSQTLAAEKTRLQMEKLQLEKDVGQGGSEMDRRLTEVHHLTSKLSKAEAGCRDAERQLHQKETRLVALETELKHVNRNNHTLESERTHLQTQLDKAKDETRDIRNRIATLEQQLNQEKNSLTEEKSSRDMLNRERAEALRQAESLQQQVEAATASLDMERRNLHNLKATLQQEEDKVFTLEETIKAQRLELDTLHCHLGENRNTIDQHKKDKQTLYQDVQELCRKLADKDDALLRLQEKCNDSVDHLQKDFNTEKAWMTKEREVLELDLAKTKEEVEELTGRLKQKDLQLDAYVRIAQELELERQARCDAETQINKLEVEVCEARHTLNTLQLDSSRKADYSKHAQESLEKAQTQVTQMKESIKTQREQYTTEINDLRLTLTTQTHKHDMERSTLQEKLNKALSDLRTKEVALSSLTESKKTLHDSSRGLEKTVESLRAQLHEEITGRKLAEQKNDSYKTQIEDLRSKRGNLDERYTELQGTLARVEAELNLEKDKYRRLKQEFSDEKSTSSTAEAHALALHTQITELQAEVSSLRTQLETQKQNLMGKNKRLTLDMKQQMENFDKERSKLVLQVQQLSSDVEAVREQVAAKNREQLKLQEDVLSLEEQLREAVSKNKHVTDALNIEEQHREKLELRNQELELKLRLRSDVDSESSKMDATRAEVNKMMSDMQKKMKEQMEQNKNVDKEAVARQQKQLEELKKKVAALESALNQEQAMHLVTKTQLSSLDEDNHRLRQQLQAARKRSTPSSEDKSKSRMEEINEIIARSQTRAQQMLASGAYAADDSMRDSMRSSTRELLSPIPFVHHLNISGHSDNRSVASDDLSRDLKA